jgi:hypothetical protein
MSVVNQNNRNLLYSPVDSQNNKLFTLESKKLLNDSSH